MLLQKQYNKIVNACMEMRENIFFFTSKLGNLETLLIGTITCVGVITKFNTGPN